MASHDMRVYTALVRGVFATRAYFLVNEVNKRALLVDPGAQADVLLGIVASHGWTVERIVLTHGHFDHWGASAELRSKLGCPVAIHQEGPSFLLDPSLNLSAQHGRPMDLEADEVFSDGDGLALAGDAHALEVLHAPGHTDDSCVLHSPELGLAFVGDTVYEGRPGLTCFPTGDAKLLQASIITKLAPLSNETLLLSGHSQPIAVGRFVKHYIPY